MSTSLQKSAAIVAQVLRGQLPIGFGPVDPTIKPGATFGEARDQLVWAIDNLFNFRMRGIDLCEEHASRDDSEREDLLEIITSLMIGVAVTISLHLALAGTAVKLASLVQKHFRQENRKNVAEIALQASLNIATNEIPTIASAAIVQAEQDAKDQIEMIFLAQKNALDNLRSDIISDFISTKASAAYAAAGGGEEANAQFEAARKALKEMALQAQFDQYFDSAGGFAATLAQQELGRFDPVTGTHWGPASGIEQFGTDVFTVEEEHPLGTGQPVDPTRTGVRGVVYLDLVNGNGAFHEDPQTGKLTLDPAWKPSYYMIPTLGMWLGGLPEKMEKRLLTRPLSEWRLPKVIVGLGGHNIRVNELDVVLVEGERSDDRIDSAASRRTYDELKPALMRMP